MNGTVNTTLEQYQEYLREQNRSKATINGYASDMRAFIVWLELERNKVRWEQLETGDLHAFIQAMQAEGDRKTNTVNRRVAALSSFFRWAFLSGNLKTNLAEDIHALPSDKVAVRFLSKDQQETLFREIEKDVRLARLRFPKRWLARQRDASMVKLLLHTGLRLAEEMNLLMSDFQMFDRKGAVIVRSANQSRERVVPLNSEARKAVLEWLAVRPEADTDYVWIAVENENPAAPLSGRSVQRVVRRFGQEAGIENLTPQMLRHTFAMNLAESGVSLEKIAALLGYVSLNAARIYTEPSLQDLQTAVEQLDAERK